MRNYYLLKQECALWIWLVDWFLIYLLLAL